MNFNYGRLNKAIDKIVIDENNNQYKMLESATNKQDEGKNYILYPPINPLTAKYFYQNSPILFKCINALTEDITLGQISGENEDINNLWINNQDELSYLCKDYLLFGYTCGEILIDEKKNKPISIKQIPADTVKLIEDNGSVYVQQTINGNTTTLTIHGEVYEPDKLRNDIEGNCIWIGGDERYKYFSIPKWFSSRNQIAANIVISDLNINNIQNGNLLTGVLAISGGRQITIDNEISFEEKLKKQFENVGVGLAVSYVENANRDQPLNMDYINLTNNNYSYIKTTYDDNEQSILECWFMPKIRLLNNTEKESMNSAKSEVLWNIYLRSCGNIQNQFLAPIHRFNNYYFNTYQKLNVALPTFENQTSIVLDNVKKLLDMGLMNNKEAVEYINQQNLDFKLTYEDNIFNSVK